jgi:MFS family permease
LRATPFSLTLLQTLNVESNFLSHLTSAVQFGFIAGTLVFALLTIADRFSPSKVFFISSLIAAVFNLAICIYSIPTSALLGARFLTGFFLAGIYPVGMKIASDHFQKGLGKSLGFLVGALGSWYCVSSFVKERDGRISLAICYLCHFYPVVGRRGS